MTPNINFPLSKARVTLPFGATYPAPYYSAAKPHRGVDLSPYPGAFGEPVDSAFTGMVSKVENHYYAGKSVFVESVSSFAFSAQNPFGNWYRVPKGAKLTTRMTHLQSVLVETGQAVRKGQQLGTIGNTGAYSTGAHLHLELWAVVEGQTVLLDPMQWFANGLAGFHDGVIYA